MLVDKQLHQSASTGRQGESGAATDEGCHVVLSRWQGLVRHDQSRSQTTSSSVHLCVHPCTKHLVRWLVFYRVTWPNQRCKLAPLFCWEKRFLRFAGILPTESSVVEDSERPPQAFCVRDIKFSSLYQQCAHPTEVELRKTKTLGSRSDSVAATYLVQFSHRCCP